VLVLVKCTPYFVVDKAQGGGGTVYRGMVCATVEAIVSSDAHQGAWQSVSRAVHGCKKPKFVACFPRVFFAGLAKPVKVPAHNTTGLEGHKIVVEELVNLLVGREQ
jgi:hypothetical protein